MVEPPRMPLGFDLEDAIDRRRRHNDLMYEKRCETFARRERWFIGTIMAVAAVMLVVDLLRMWGE